MYVVGRAAVASFPIDAVPIKLMSLLVPTGAPATIARLEPGIKTSR